MNVKEMYEEFLNERKSKLEFLNEVVLDSKSKNLPRKIKVIKFQIKEIELIKEVDFDVDFIEKRLFQFKKTKSVKFKKIIDSDVPYSVKKERITKMNAMYDARINLLRHCLKVLKLESVK